MTKIYHIYDKMFKKILTLSSRAVTGLINGLFGTNYPPESQIDYNWTEFHDNNLRRTLADTILTINQTNSYHMEAQITEDEEIIFRVFDYGYKHANLHRQNDAFGCEMIFPEPKVIYLGASEKLPDNYTLSLNFGSQGSFSYQVSVFKFLKTSVEELNRKKMIILIPFHLLKLKDRLAKKRTKDDLDALKHLIEDDIIGSIEENLKLGNITEDDALKLKRLTYQLYTQIYSHYKEMEDVNEMTDQSLMLDIDYIEERHEKEIAQIIAEKDSVLAEKDAEIAKKDGAIAEKDKALAEKEAENAQLRAQLAALQAAK